MDDARFKTCRRVLTGVSAYVIVLGLWVSLFPQSSLMRWLLNDRIDYVFWGNQALPGNFLQYQSWIYGLLGATIIGWGVLMLFISLYALAKKEKWAWYSLLISFSSWYFIDTSVSLIHEVHVNSIFNTLIFLVVVVPLALIRKPIFEKVETVE